MTERPGEQVPLRLGEAARLAGAYRWTEHRLFELTGSWAGEEAEPAVQVHLDEVSAQHSWHAELWAQRLPVLDDVDPDELTRPAGRALEPVLAVLSTTKGLVPRLAGLYRVVVPRLLVTYDRHLAQAVPATDGPTIRALRLLLRDELEGWQSGERLLQSVLSSPEQVAAAAQAQERLEGALAAAQPGEGLLPWPGASRRPRAGGS